MITTLKRAWVSDFFSKWQKMPQNPVSILQSKTNQLTESERFVVFEDIFGNVTEIMDHSNNTKIQIKPKKLLRHSIRKVSLALLHHIPENFQTVNIKSCPNGLLRNYGRTHSLLISDTSEANSAISAKE